MPDGPDENAVIRLSWFDHAAILAAREQGIAIIQGQSRLSLVHAIVAIVAMLRQNRPYLRFEEGDLFGSHAET